MIPLLLQMGDLDMPELSYDNSGFESSSWIANIMDWDYESDETNPEIIYSNPMDSDDITDLMGQEGMDVVSDAESVRLSPKGIFSLKVFGGILARLKTGTYMITMMTGDATTNPRWKMRILKKAVRVEVWMILVQLLEGK